MIFLPPGWKLIEGILYIRLLKIKRSDALTCCQQYGRDISAKTEEFESAMEGTPT